MFPAVVMIPTEIVYVLLLQTFSVKQLLCYVFVAYNAPIIGREVHNSLATSYI